MKIKGTLRHFWTVRCDVSNTYNGKPYRHGAVLGVVATSLEEAARQAVAMFPDIAIWAINHHGEIHVDQAPEVTSPQDGGSHV